MENTRGADLGSILGITKELTPLERAYMERPDIEKSWSFEQFTRIQMLRFKNYQNGKGPENKHKLGDSVYFNVRRKNPKKGESSYFSRRCKVQTVLPNMMYIVETASSKRYEKHYDDLCKDTREDFSQVEVPKAILELNVGTLLRMLQNDRSSYETQVFDGIVVTREILKAALSKKEHKKKSWERKEERQRRAKSGKKRKTSR